MTDPIVAALARALITETQGTVALNLGAVEAAIRAPRLIEAFAAEGLVLVSAERLAKLREHLLHSPLTHEHSASGHLDVGLRDIAAALAALDEEERR